MFLSGLRNWLYLPYENESSSESKPTTKRFIIKLL